MSLAEQDKFAHARSNAQGWFESIKEMLANRQKELGGNTAGVAENAENTIHESALSVEVRSGWYTPGTLNADTRPAEYNILLTTGGPALRIFGQLSEYGEPETAELQMQDWGTYWERYPAPEEILLDFARCFYFGE